MGVFPGGVKAWGWLGWFAGQSAQARALALSPAHSVTDTHAAPLASPPLQGTNQRSVHVKTDGSQIRLFQGLLPGLPLYPLSTPSQLFLLSLCDLPTPAP